MTLNSIQEIIAEGTTSDEKKLGLISSIAVVVGNMVGIGIFLTPAEVARASPDMLTFVGIWLVGTLMAIAGAQVYAELGVLFPKAGGDYRFLFEAYGPRPARAWGWMSVFGCFPASIATLAVGVTVTLSETSMGFFLNNQLLSFHGIHITPATFVGLALIWISTAVNVSGLSISGRTQLLVTLVPILTFVVAGIFATGSSFGGQASQPNNVVPNISLVTTALCAVFFTFSGWNVITYLGGEIHRPKLNIPRVIVAAISITTVIFLILNLSFLSVIPLPRLAATQNAGVAVATSIFGDPGRDIFGLLLAMAIVAGLNATVMVGSRISVAMAETNQVWRGLAHRSGARETPQRALVMQAVIASVLVLSGSFTMLITVTGGVMIVLSCLTVSTIFVFHRKLCIRPTSKVWGYPWTAIIYLLAGGSISAMIAIDDIRIFLAGVAAFFLLMYGDLLNPRAVISKLTKRT